VILDWLLAALSEFGDFCHNEIVRRSWFDWLLFGIPILFFMEIPRNYVPVFGVMLMRWLGLPRVDRAAREALLRRAPLVSVVLAGRNESPTIERCIRSLLEQDYPNYEIIVVDDASDDGMYSIARRYAGVGPVQVIRNRATRGRGGRPHATNLGVRYARGEFLISLDADTVFDGQMIRRMVAAFADRRVGVVAGNVASLNWDHNLLTRIQTIEYGMAIDLHKRFTSALGFTLQASGALGGFRLAAVRELGGWDPELAEDSDVSLRMIKAGWRVAFAPDAVALTNVPTTMRALAKQRDRWDRGGLRVFFLKHLRLMNPWATRNPRIALELALQGFFFVFSTWVFPFYLIWLWTQGWLLMGFVLMMSMVAYVLLSLATLIPISVMPDHSRPVRSLLFPALVLPFYKEWLRWVRARAFIEEFLLVRVDDPFLPSSAWANSPRF